MKNSFISCVVSGGGSHGGAISAELGTHGTLSVENAQFEECRATGTGSVGGGVYETSSGASGVLKMLSVVFEDCTATNATGSNVKAVTTHPIPYSPPPMEYNHHLHPLSLLFHSSPFSSPCHRIERQRLLCILTIASTPSFLPIPILPSSSFLLHTTYTFEQEIIFHPDIPILHSRI